MMFLACAALTAVAMAERSRGVGSIGSLMGGR